MSAKLIETLQTLAQEASAQLQSAGLASKVEELRVHYLGKKGKISEVLSGLKDLSGDDRKKIGQVANEIKTKLEADLSAKKEVLSREELNASLLKDSLDVTAPGIHLTAGARHPVKQIFNQAIAILEKAGLSAVYGPEVEYEDFNFDRLNFKPGHAARDMQATFFVKNNPSDKELSPLVLRTHTSPVPSAHLA